MAADLNSVTLVARLVRDPVLRSLPSGQSVCELRVAFNTSKRTPNGWEDEGNYINVTVWGAQGEAIARNLTKGQRVGVQGRLQHRTWQAQDGSNREQHSIVAERVQYLDPKPQSGGGGSSRPATPAAAPPVPADDGIPF